MGRLDMVVEILLGIGICVAVFFAVRYIVRTHRQGKCVGCSMANQCQNRERCPKEKDGRDKS